jgi:hypothetical protein
VILLAIFVIVSYFKPIRKPINSQWNLHCISLFGTVFHCLALYFIVWHCISLFGTVFHCLALYFIVWHCISLFGTVFRKHCTAISQSELRNFFMYIRPVTFISGGIRLRFLQYTVHMREGPPPPLQEEYVLLVCLYQTPQVFSRYSVSSFSNTKLTRDGFY